MDTERINQAVESGREEIVRFMVDLCSIPAVNPSFGGKGEYQRATWLANYLQTQGLPVEKIEVADETVPEGKRLNLVSRIPGRTQSGTLWLIGHMDTVAPGDPADWKSDPFQPVVKDGKIFGRGVEDNCQSIGAMVAAALVAKRLGLRPEREIGLIFVSDEEAGSDKGLKALIERGLFRQGDEALVPDGGAADGSFIEVAEKSILWCRFTVLGKETHGSRPDQGINAGWAGSLLAVDLIDTLREKFRDRDPLFDPPYSTFELTQKFNNVGSPNVIPGKDSFVTDFRVLPQWNLQELIDEIDRIVTRYEYDYNVKIGYELLQRQQAPAPTPVDAPVIKKLSAALKERGLTPSTGGIGGGTCAAFLREIGIPAAVWCTIDEVAHQPNEYCIVDNLVADTKTLLQMMLG